jgi:diguanylate cyclase (GGDEF)-like protein/PAS domain S-box-containing protein
MSVNRAAAPELNSTPARVLVVDDRPTSRAILTSALAPPEFQTTTAGGGKEALALVSSQHFDLVILDIVMPDVDGFEVLKQIRRQYSESELPVILATVRGQTSDMVQGLELGANDYVTKPIEFPALLARSRAQISRKRAEEALRLAYADMEEQVAMRTAELVQTNKALSAEIAERKEVERALRESQETLQRSEKRYRSLYDHTPSMFFTIETNGSVVAVNNFAIQQLGYSADALVGMPFSGLYASADWQELQQHLQTSLGNPEHLHRWELKMLRKGGEAVWIRHTARVVDDVDGVRRIFVVCEDITEAHALSERLSYQARHDELTGLLNRHAFQQLLRAALGNVRTKNAQHALCYLDLDQFKVINDTCGHVAGDELLRQLGRWLREQVQGSDTLARLGGDEFAVLLEDCSIEEAERVADSVRKAIEKFRFRWADKTFSIGVSIGLVPVTRSMSSITALLSVADTVCYAAKEEGRNRIHTYREDDADIARRRGEMQWVARINRALEEEQFCLSLQPIMRLTNTRESAEYYELLVQLRDEDGLFIRAESFMPAAERYNVCTKVDRWVISTAFNWLAQRRQRVTPNSCYSINLSGQSLGDEEFLRFVTDQFEQTKIPAKSICFEITETAAIANLSHANTFVAALRERGCLFALDDFGIGLSSFAYLKTLPVDYVKIDGVFVRNVTDSPVDLAMVRAINEIAHVMGKETIAEFVESEDILRKVREAGVDYAQGNAVGHPRRIDEIAC